MTKPETMRKFSQSTMISYLNKICLRVKDGDWTEFDCDIMDEIRKIIRGDKCPKKQ